MVTTLKEKEPPMKIAMKEVKESGVTESVSHFLYTSCFCILRIKAYASTSMRIRPLQINSLFPVHCPLLVTTSSKYSIIPYSSIIFRLFLHTDRLSKSYLETVTAHVSAVLSSRHNFTFVLFLQFTKEGTRLSMFAFLAVPGK